MGLSRQGIHGNYWKRVGNVVARTVKGRVVLSIYQPNVSNPRTAKQTSQRNKFVAVIRAYNAFSIWAARWCKGWFPFGTGWSNFVKENFAHYQTQSGEVRWDRVTISRGSLLNPANPSAAIEAGVLTASWSDNSGQGNATSNDVVAICVYNSAKDVVVFNDNAATRVDREGTINLPSAWNSDNVEVYLCCVSPDGSLRSNSLYLGSLSV